MLIPQKYMVVGGDGFIGKIIAENLRKSGKDVITTSRRTKNLSDSCIFLDLKKNISCWEVPNDVNVAFLCAGVTKIEECRKHPEESKIVNVENTIKLAYKLLETGISVIYPSTNYVFDGQRPARKIDEPTCPRIEYGRQKAMVEKRLIDLGQNISIVRFSKILGMESPILIKNWINQLKNKITIHPFSDYVLAPLSVDFVSRIIIEIAEREKIGIWHVSAKEDISYAELAMYIAKKLCNDQKYVKPIKAMSSGLIFEWIPKYTSLDTSRIEKELGWTPPNVWDTINSVYELES